MELLFNATMTGFLMYRPASRFKAWSAAQARLQARLQPRVGDVLWAARDRRGGSAGCYQKERYQMEDFNGPLVEADIPYEFRNISA